MAAKEYISYAHVIQLSSTNGVSYQVCCSTHNEFQKLTSWRDRGWAGVLKNQWKKWETKIPCFLWPMRVTGALHDGPTQLNYCDENVDVISLHSNRIQQMHAPYCRTSTVRQRIMLCTPSSIVQSEPNRIIHVERSVCVVCTTGRTWYCTFTSVQVQYHLKMALTQ